eukprot:2316934-Lingulodinium_polyedra.AAC.1
MSVQAVLLCAAMSHSSRGVPPGPRQRCFGVPTAPCLRPTSARPVPTQRAAILPAFLLHSVGAHKHPPSTKP